MFRVSLTLQPPLSFLVASVVITFHLIIQIVSIASLLNLKLILNVHLHLTTVCLLLVDPVYEFLRNSLLVLLAQLMREVDHAWSW